MSIKKSLITTLLFCVAGAPLLAAADGDWKRGRVYYRQVCSSCHMAQSGKAISPTLKTKAEWTAYLQANKHNKGKDTVKHYVSQQYRNSIKATNKAAEKYADLPDQQLLDDIKAFVIHGAKDGDSPASCS